MELSRFFLSETFSTKKVKKEGKNGPVKWHVDLWSLSVYNYWYTTYSLQIFFIDTYQLRIKIIGTILRLNVALKYISTLCKIS